MGSFKLLMECTNAAFDRDDMAKEIARVLSGVAKDVAANGLRASATGPLIDSNGNQVGTWRYTPEAA